MSQGTYWGKMSVLINSCIVNLSILTSMYDPFSLELNFIFQMFMKG